MKNKNILILGALSDIAKSISKKFAENGYDLILAARNREKLQKESDNLKNQYNINISTYEFDVLKTETHQNFIKNLEKIPSIVICSIGFMGEQKENENKSELRNKVLRTNFEGPINIISDFANIYEKQKYGTIVGISSVAGERGKSSNYIYGSAKAGFTAFLSGLRNRLAKKNVHVITVLPGPVNTKMISNLEKPGLLTTNTSNVANDIYSAVLKKKNIIYTMKIWRIIMFIIKIIPEQIFKKLKI